MAMILLIQLSDWFYSPKHSEITQKRIMQLYYDKTMVHFCKGCDVKKKKKILNTYLQIIIWSNKTTVNLWLPWLQEQGNSKRILRQMLMVKLLDIINVNSQKSFTGLWTYMKMMHGLHLGLFPFSFLGPGLLMSFPGHSFRSFMIICI